MTVTHPRPPDAAPAEPPDEPSSREPSTRPDADGLASAYRQLQVMVGLIALLLPAVLILGSKAISGGPWFQSSLSAYYYTHTRNIFVGALCAIGVFFLGYQHRPLEHGFEVDKWVANIAALGALGVAFFPTAPSAATSDWVSTVHGISAGVLFTCLAIFCLFLFTRDRDTPPIAKATLGAALTGALAPPKDADLPEKGRHAIYIACGVIIVVAMAVAGLSNWRHWHLFMWTEVVAVVAFATSWLARSTKVVTPA
jgi:Protein of unknown function (DUF998)